MLQHEQLRDYVNKQWKESIVPSLFDYIKIPNQSPAFDPLWEEHGFMEKAILHMVAWCKENAPMGMKLEILRLPKRTPLIYIEVPGAINDTVLLYGHLDKQPEMVGWNEGLSPWEPVLQEERLYGRGAADDGYAIYAALTAIRALQLQELPHARCVILIEASEESGSPDLPFYMNLLADTLGTPSLIICLDSGAGNYEQLWLTNSLRGAISAELSVELLSEGVHSGSASGIVADSFRVARLLLSRIEDETTGQIRLDAFHGDIPLASIEAASASAAVLGSHVFSEFPWQEGVSAVHSDKTELLLNRTWRPTLTVTGADGLPPVSSAGNVLRPKTVLKLSLRLPPVVDANEAAKALLVALTENPPYGAKVNLIIHDAASGWQAPEMFPWFSEAVNTASMLFYQKPFVSIGEGGSIPFMGMLGKQFPAAQFMITGVLGPHSNAHGPNEFLHLDMARKLTASVAYVIYAQSTKK